MVLLHRYEYAKTPLLNAVEEFPDSYELWSNLAVCYFFEDNLLQSELCYKKALELEYSPDVIVPYVSVLIHMNKTFEATNHILYLMNNHPEDPEEILELCKAVEDFGDF